MNSLDPSKHPTVRAVGSTLTTASIHEKPRMGPLHQALEVDRLGNFILLTGTSTAGKSTIMNALGKEQQNVYALGVDDFGELHIIGIIKRFLPQDYQALAQALEDKQLPLVCHPEDSIHDVLKENPHIFKPEVTEGQKKAAIELLANRTPGNFKERFKSVLAQHNSEAIEQEAHFTALLEQAKQGKTVIFDTPNPAAFYAFLQTRHVQQPVQHLLVYLPINNLVERVNTRNEEAIRSGQLSNKRNLTAVIHCFLHHYRPAIEQKGSGIDILHKATIEGLFTRYAKEIDAENALAVANGRKALTKEAALAHFGLVDPTKDHVFIAPNFELLNGIFRTATQTPEVIATQLCTRTYERISKT